MARMSIDDSFLRDPKVMRLAKRVGWSRRETMGALLDVWAVSYDRATAVLPAEDIDIAAQQDNFACDLIVVGLASQVDEGVRLNGASDRILYLNHKSEAGKKGGQKSGISRRNKREAKTKQCFDNSEARGNPIPNTSAPDLPNPSAPDPVPALAPTRARQAKAFEIPLPAEWEPTPEHAGLARERGVNLADQARAFRFHAEAHDRRAKRWNAAFSQWLLKSRPDPANRQTGLEAVLAIANGESA